MNVRRYTNYFKCYEAGRVVIFDASIKTMRFLLSQRVCVRAIFFYTESLQQPMDLLVSSKFVLSQIDVLSFSDYSLSCSFDRP